MVLIDWAFCFDRVILILLWFIFQLSSDECLEVEPGWIMRLITVWFESIDLTLITSFFLVKSSNYGFNDIIHTLNETRHLNELQKEGR